MAHSAWEPNFERMLTVIRREGEPDRLPFFELFHDGQVMAAAIGEALSADPDEWRRQRIRFMTAMGYDYVVGYQTCGFPNRSRLLAEDTAALTRGQRSWQDEHHGPLETWEGFHAYEWPQPADEHFEDIEKLEPLLPDGMKVTATLPGGVFENLSWLMGYEPLCFALIEQPDLVQATVDRIGEVELQVYHRLCQFDHVGAVWLNDDLGFKSQTMISPDDLRRLVFPWYRRLIGYAHEHGKPVLMHSCGNLAEIIDELIDDCGIDAKHSFEDAIIPVTEFKRRYGDRVAVLGGIDVDVLAGRDEEEVRRYTRNVVEQCAPGGGWALGSGNSIANYIPVENFLAMLDEGRKAGVYGG